MTIRTATTDDIPHLIHIATASILEGCEKEYTLHQRQVWSDRLASEPHWKKILTTQQVWLALEGEQPLGLTALDGVEHIDYLYVHPAAHRQGIATQLYHMLLHSAKAQSAQRLYSEVSHTARPFFERMGWQVERVQTVYIDEVAFTNNAMFLVLES